MKSGAHPDNKDLGSHLTSFAQSRDYSQGFHDHFLPVLGALWSCVLYRLEGVRTMVAQDGAAERKH